MANGRPAILAEGLEKSYGETRALRDLNLEVAGFDGYMAMECAVRGDARTVLSQVVRHLRSLMSEEGGTP